MSVIAKLDTTKLKDGIRTYQANQMGNYDPSNSTEVAPPGVDCAPPDVKNLKVIYDDTARNGKSVCYGVINTNQKSLAGEVRMYSQDGETEKAKIWIHKDGKIEIGGTSDAVNPNHLVRFEDLNTILQNQVIIPINLQLDLIAAAINVIAPGSYTPTHLSLDLTLAKTDDLLII